MSALEGHLDALRETNRMLIDQIVTLKREGFTMPPSTETMAEVGLGIPDELVAVIEEVARPGTEAWSQVTGEVQKLLRSDAPPEAIREMVLTGEPFEW